MKIAIIIHGEPRFCEEFDMLINQVKDIEQVDWFFYMWSNTEQQTYEEIVQLRSQLQYPHSQGYTLVAPNWCNIDSEWAMAKLRSNIPAHHNIVRAEFVDHRGLTFDPPPTDNYAQEIQIDNVCKSWHSLHQVDLLRQQHEAENNFKYDLVIRSRADVAVTSDLDFKSMLGLFATDKSVVLIPNNRCCGYDGVAFCDLFAIGSSESMKVYSDCINQAWEHNRNGVKFHGETMLARHLTNNNIRYNVHNFSVEIRHLGAWHSTATGQTWASGEVPDWSFDKIYKSNFGQWA
jgi:hypothetical protein